MISMTGFGESKIEMDGRIFSVEVKSVNHRFLDVKLRLPPSFSAHESTLTAQIRRFAQRGSVTLSIREQEQSASAEKLNLQIVERHLLSLASIESLVKSRYQEKNTEWLQSVTLFLAGQSGVLKPLTTELTLDENSLTKGVENALTTWQASREREGQALQVDLEKNLSKLLQLHKTVEKLAENAPQDYQAKLQERLQNLLSEKISVDRGRLEQEVALFASNIDTQEELSRLLIHIEEFLRLCKTMGPLGKQLEFLLQEIHREINTLGSKSQSAEIAHHVVQMKAAVEALREQIQNVE